MTTKDLDLDSDAFLDARGDKDNERPTTPLPNQIDFPQSFTTEKIKALIRIKRGTLTRGIKTLESYIINEFDHNILLKAYEKCQAAKTDLDTHFQQLTFKDDMSSESLAEELNTQDNYTNNFEKIEETYYAYMNKILKQNEIIDNVHKSYQNAAAVSPYHSTTSSDSSRMDLNKLNIRYKPIEIPVFDASKTEILSFHDWLNLFRHAADNLPDYAMRAVLLQNTLAGESKALIRSLPLNEQGYNDAMKLLCSNYANVRKTFQINVKKILEYAAPRLDGKREPNSKTLRTIWSDLNCIVRSIQNCNRISSEEEPDEQLNTEDLLQVIVHFKLPYTLSREFEQLRDEKKVKSIDEMFHLLSDIISRREITEVNTSRPTFCGTSQNDDEQDNNRQGGYGNGYGYGGGSSRPT